MRRGALSASEQRDVVAQAIGIVRAQFGVDDEAAFEKMILVARRDACTIYELSVEIVEHIELR